MQRKPRIGLALGAGSARGWAHIGAIRALEERNIKPEVICGTSIGALVGAAYASAQLHKLEEWVSGLAWTTVVRLMDLTWKGGLIRGERLFKLFRATFEEHDIAQLPVVYGAVATELASGREVWLREGNVLDAVRASIAMPGLFTPVVRDGVVLVDGGLYRERGKDHTAVAPQREVPGWLERLRPARAERPATEQAERVTIPSIFEVFNTALDIGMQKVARSRLAGDPADVLITPLLPDFGSMEYHRSREAIEEGRAAVERMAPLLEQVIG